MMASQVSRNQGPGGASVAVPGDRTCPRQARVLSRESLDCEEVQGCRCSWALQAPRALS